ncbi:MULTISPECIES: multidrug transporter subunit MdtN [Enterobacteriaceae]|uniref:Inner membrane protein yibH n=2 Tax=Citrobacter TaxID=544 RepID=A0A9N8CYZ1_9ENTR|nr:MULTISPECIES: multidrug transporter subunit MdtN [Enterobacteriaceae]MDT9876917.1 multidrug transporter subunit MdtN [Enterobacter cloacae]HAU5665114.1 multidrug transporter subunit MdtN [Citrobacter freundii]MDV0597978.1 multidrug transporter subunit MdtN [Enterobacter sp. 23-M-SZ-13]UZQ67065.1 multidrug transporter subunit MdtN [Enterobacter kobei]CAB5594357.1 Inner membrane protein yibH [Citrobacter werkmanii]
MTHAMGFKWYNKYPLLIIMFLAAISTITLVIRTQVRPETNDAWGYADTIDVVPGVSVRIILLPIKDNQYIDKEDLLLKIESQPYLQYLAVAQARLNTLNQQIMLAQHTVSAQTYNAKSAYEIADRARVVAEQARGTRIRCLKRVLTLPMRWIRQDHQNRLHIAELNTSKLQTRPIGGVDAPVAYWAELEAQIALTKLGLEFTEIRAPFNGWVTSLKTTVGQFTSVLKPLLFILINTERWYVIANYRKTGLKHIREGDRSKLLIE